MTCGTCAECGRGVIQQRAWGNATAEERAAWKDAGHRVLCGHELCRTCYQRGYRRSPFRVTPAPPAPTSHCGRCGIPGGVLCVDCRDVTADLNEVSRWVA